MALKFGIIFNSKFYLLNENLQIIRNIVNFTFLISASDEFLLTFNTSYNLLSAIFHFEEEKKSRGDSIFFTFASTFIYLTNAMLSNL